MELDKDYLCPGGDLLPSMTTSSTLLASFPPQTVIIGIFPTAAMSAMKMARLCRSLYLSALLATPFIDHAVAADWPYWTFTTVPFQPPKLNITTAGEAPDPGLIFLGPRGDQPNGTAAMIYDQAGNLVYQGPHEVTANVNVQTLFGKPVLTFWSGNMLDTGFGYGKVHILDDTYKEIYTVTLDGNFITPSGTAEESYNDLHESKITERNTMLVTAYNVTQANLTAVGGPEDGWMLDGHFYEIDIFTKQIFFSWSTANYSDQIPITLSRNPIADRGRNQSHPWDPYHINSIELVDDGYLVSFRHLFSVLYLNRDGSIKWRLSVGSLSTSLPSSLHKNIYRGIMQINQQPG